MTDPYSTLYFERGNSLEWGLPRVGLTRALRNKDRFCKTIAAAAFIDT